MPRDPYEVLGVARDADDGEIKKAFRKLARQLHPDVNSAETAEEDFKEAAEAYEILSDPERKATYDRYGFEGLRSGGYAPPDAEGRRPRRHRRRPAHPPVRARPRGRLRRAGRRPLRAGARARRRALRARRRRPRHRDRRARAAGRSRRPLHGADAGGRRGG